jgi:hypothetical protein
MKRLSWIVAGLVAVAASFFLFFFFRDNFATHYPLKVLSAEAFRNFEIPWWNFHDGGGQPLAGNPNALSRPRPGRTTGRRRITSPRCSRSSRTRSREGDRRPGARELGC